MSVKEIKQAILKLRDDLPTKEYEIAGQKVIIKAPTAYLIELWRFWQKSDDEIVRCSAPAKLVQLCLFDNEGNQIFDEKEINKIVALPARIVDEIVDITLDIGGYSARGREAILKNLKKILGDDGLRELLGNTNAQSPNSSNDTQPTS